MKPADLKVAVTAWTITPTLTAAELAKQGAIAESLGAHSFWLPENHFGDERSLPSPLTMLAAVAAGTSTIGLGSTSYLLPIRHPLQAAEEVAVLDRLSGGRVILGVGRGTQDAMFRAFGVETKDKRKRFRTSLDAMISAWAGEPVAHLEDGKPVCLAPLPLQRPHPPIWLAAFGPLAIKQAGSLGLPYLASPVETLSKLESNYRSHAEHAREAGHSPPADVPVMRTVYVTDSVSEAREVRSAIDASMPHAMRDAEASVDDWAIVGDAAYVADRLAEHQARLGMTHVIVRGRLPGLSDDAHIKSLERLFDLVGGRVSPQS